MYYVFYRLLSTTYFKKLVYYLIEQTHCLYLPLFLQRITADVCTSGVTDETDVVETCTDVDWISLVACALGVTGETIATWTCSGVDEKTRVACTMGVTEETVVAWSCTEVGGTTYDVAGTRVVS